MEKFIDYLLSYDFYISLASIYVIFSFNNINRKLNKILQKLKNK
jgi:hypothetical protein